MNKYLYDFSFGGGGVCFKLLKFNFLSTVNTMHYLIYGNFDQVYACSEITDFVYKKMLEYHSEKTLIRKEQFNFQPQGLKEKRKHPNQKENYWEIMLNALQGPYIKYAGGNPEGFCGGHEVFQGYINGP